ncbi:MAG TPA: putative manganese-dependent inorganic diphosphatase [Candidatus Onthousia faecavium]|nr:putative manganese-dependent inorganic diphosphatase [Candidatus Onthousia faecavium]
MDKIYVFGHRKPDTDSVSAAISYATLKKKLGFNTEPRILSAINKETKYALDYFGVKEPLYLNDVKLQLKDINYHKNYFINEKSSIYDSYLYMLKEGLTGVPIVDSDENFKGIITIKDLAKAFIDTKVEALNTSYDNLLKVLNAKEINRVDEEISGNILAASYRSTTIINNVKFGHDDILIVGDRHSVIEYAVNSNIKMLIISGDSEIKDKHIEIAKQNKVNVIRSSYDTYHIAKLISLANYIYTMKKTTGDGVYFDENDYVADILDVNKKLRHTNYPVVNTKTGKCLGLLRITDLDSKNPKQVILVDHNEQKQSAIGLEEAEILEIVDHHNLSSLTTVSPINFRNMAVGSSCTIIYTLYKEKDVAIPKEIAGMMLSGILSDTLILKSPTTTDLDKEAVHALAEIADVNYEEYGLNLIKAGTSLEGMSHEDVLYNDFKLYTVDDKTLGIGQFFTTNFEDIEKELDAYLDTLDREAEGNNYFLIALYITDIIKNGSYVLYNRKAKDFMELVYDKEIAEGEYIPDCVSRKKNVVPLIMSSFDK